MRLRREGGDYRILLANTTAGTDVTIPAGLNMESFLGAVVEIGESAAVTAMYAVTAVTKGTGTYTLAFGDKTATYTVATGVVEVDSAG